MKRTGDWPRKTRLPSSRVRRRQQATPVAAGVDTPEPSGAPPRVAVADSALPRTGRSKLAKPIPLSMRRAVKARAGGCCEACGCYIYNGGHIHHRKLRSQGGQHTPDNLILVCFPCHDRIHRNPDLSRVHGLIVPREQDPADVTVTPW